MIKVFAYQNNKKISSFVIFFLLIESSFVILNRERSEQIVKAKEQCVEGLTLYNFQMANHRFLFLVKAN